MKMSSAVIVFICFAPLYTLVQSTITIKQHGNSNKVAIKQANTETSDTNCNAVHLKATNKNKILVQSTGNQTDTLLYSINNLVNLISTFLYGHKLRTYQYDSGNNLLLITLPDSQHAPVQFKTNQNGTENSIITQTGNMPLNISLSQNGSRNSITMNPCKSNRN